MKLEGSYEEQIVELVQIGDLSTFVLFPATVKISDENRMERDEPSMMNVFRCVGKEKVCNESTVFLFPFCISCYPVHL